MVSVKVDYKQNPVLKQLSDVFHYENMGIFWTISEDFTFFEEFFKETFIGRRGFSLKMYSPLVFVIHQLPFHWQWWKAPNRWLASPPTTHQRLVLKQLPHKKCMAKLWNVIATAPLCFLSSFEVQSFSRTVRNNKLITAAFIIRHACVLHVNKMFKGTF